MLQLIYLKKPIDLEELLLSIQKAEAVAMQSSRLDYSRQRNAHATEGVEILGDRLTMQSVKAKIQRFSQIGAVNTAPPTILISAQKQVQKKMWRQGGCMYYLRIQINLLCGLIALLCLRS